VFRIDDILAALILALCMMRRLEVFGILPEQNSHVPEVNFQSWRKAQLGAYHLCALACLLKLVLSLLWLWLAPPAPWLQVGGLSFFVLWIGALTYAWHLSTEARAVRNQLGIQGRTRPKKS
jgi:hypothetical protein